MFRQDCKEIKSFSLGSDSFGDSGCAICSTVAMAEQLTGRCYDTRDISIKCLDLFSDNIIGKDFYVKDWIKLLYSFGIKAGARKELSTYICDHDEEEILRLKKPGYEHFVYGDGTSHYSYDSLGRRPAQKDYRVSDKWVFKIKEIL